MLCKQVKLGFTRACRGKKELGKNVKKTIGKNFQNFQNLSKSSENLSKSLHCSYMDG